MGSKVSKNSLFRFEEVQPANKIKNEQLGREKQ